ncbi:prepilin peptidase [Candidatus Gottesmanbacteria bacterium]|nr:prepilin peptidase [Candidatus Gottesmanbacteria bacterium]
MLNIFISGILFLLGICIGSFLNVVSDRLPRGLTLGGRSRCDHCKKILGILDLVPVISYLLLSGKCRYCKRKIAWQYTAVEIVTGITFVILYIFFPLNLSFFFRLILYSCLIAIFLADIKFRIIPDQLVILMGIAAIMLRFWDVTFGWEAILSGLALSFIFLILYLLTSGRGMGMGDVKFAFVMGLMLGFPVVIVGFYVAFLTGALVSIILILGGKKRFGQTIAFGPFLVLATVISDIFGDRLWELFQKMVLP